jgi:hypothetical protein
MGLDLRDNLRAGLRRHPRVAYQGFCGDAAAWSRLADAIPAIAPFGQAQHMSGLWVLDWDHRLPSKTLTLRLYAFYDEAAHHRGMLALDAREEEIASEDRFPEFDVPDFAALPADEAYEAELAPGGLPGKLRLVSDWRRDIDPALARRAIDLARRSEPFQDLRRTIRFRPAALGDLEAAEWTPPCESGHRRWGIDVWYLITFNGVVGEGRAFLVDLEEGAVVQHRDFQFRSG